MYIKDGVSIRLLQACMISAIFVCSEYFVSIGKPFVITSGNDGKHKNGSFHYTGLAFDLRSRELTAKEVQNLVTYFRTRLDSCYDIVIEIDHIHVEYDEHKIIEPWP